MILVLIACFLRSRAPEKAIVRFNSCPAGFPLFQRIVKTCAIFLAFLGIPGGKGHLHPEQKRKTMKYIMDDTVPHCLECGDPLPYGRKDRTFCSPACKNRHHNREARQWRIRYASIIGILEKNHDILRQLIQIGVRSIPKEELIQLGYRMGFVTSSGRVGRRTVCRCFDVVFIDMETRISGLELESPPWDRELSGTA